MYCLKKGEICDDLKKVHVTWYRLCNTGVSKDINAQIRSKMAAGSESSRQLSETQYVEFRSHHCTMEGLVIHTYTLCKVEFRSHHCTMEGLVLHTYTLCRV